MKKNNLNEKEMKSTKRETRIKRGKEESLFIQQELPQEKMKARKQNKSSK